jgi:hypothetical protein
MYEMKLFEFSLVNPFQADCEFQISLHPVAHAQTKTPVPPKAGKKAPSVQQVCAMQLECTLRCKLCMHNQQRHVQSEDRSLYPHPFGIFKSLVKLAKNGEEKIRAAFLPFTSGVHLCTVKFADREHGSFCYELEGLALPPAICAEHEFIMDLHSPSTVHIPLSINNVQLDSARKLFMEGHPLAKVKEQVQLLKSQKNSANPQSAWMLEEYA